MARKAPHTLTRWCSIVTILVLGVACWSKSPRLEDFLVPTTPPMIGSIQARTKVIQAVLASQQNQRAAAARLFEEAHALDPHPTIQRLAHHCLNLSVENTLNSTQPLLDE